MTGVYKVFLPLALGNQAAHLQGYGEEIFLGACRRIFQGWDNAYFASQENVAAWFGSNGEDLRSHAAYKVGLFDNVLAHSQLVLSATVYQ